MRKVFMSAMLLGRLFETEYISDDYEVEGKKYNFPLTYIIDQEVQPDDEVVVITIVERGDGNVQTAALNYETYVEEVKKVIGSRTNNLTFFEVTTHKEFHSLTFNRFFKDISSLIKEEDKIYADMTFGMKAYSLSMFVALGYVSKAGEDISVEQLIYAQKYTGTDEAASKNTSKIYDITTLLYLNSVANSAAKGQKKQYDQLLNLMICD